VADDVHRGEAEFVDQPPYGRLLGADRAVEAVPHRGVAVPDHVDGDGPASVGDGVELGVEEIGVRRDAVDEHHRVAGPLVPVGHLEVVVVDGDGRAVHRGGLFVVCRHSGVTRRRVARWDQTATPYQY